MSRFKDALNVMQQARESTGKATPDKAGPSAPAEAPTRAGGGKKRDPHYTQCNGYISRELYKRVRLALVEDERELGELLEQLLTNWLASRERKK